MTTKRRRLLIVVSAAAGLMVAALVALAFRLPYSSDRLRQNVIESLSAQLDAEVELAELRLRIFPRIRMYGEKLAIRHKGRRDVPPLISVEAFTVHADLMGLWRRHVARVELVGLDIEIPPGDDDNGKDDDDDSRLSQRVREVVVDEVIANDAKLVILRRDLNKKPKTWYMHELHVESVGINQSMAYRTVLTNGVPPGLITASGEFGPWHVRDPGQSPLEGDFIFENADLGVFKGISGTLSSRGTFGGSLDRIDVSGETDTPDFMVKISGQSVPLKTRYRAIVDGTNGDTRLEQIDASFLQTSFTAKGGVFDVEGVDGRVVMLDVSMDKARLEDLMRLAVKTPKPPMTGALRLTTKFELPPGDRDVVEKLKLDGAFAIDDGQFTDPVVQQKINELSRRASGRKVETIAQKVSSDFSGRFILANGVLSLPTVAFDVPGAAVQLAGQYSLEAERLNFTGSLFMDAKVSQMTTGYKSLLLRLVDPLFRKNGLTVIPLKITGTRDNPSFGMDVKRVFKRGN